MTIEYSCEEFKYAGHSIGVHFYDNGVYDKPVAVIIHGAMSNAQSMKDFAEAMAHKGENQIVVIDLPGHGISQCEPIGDLSKLATYLCNVINELRFSMVISKELILIGHSMGGMLVTLMSTKLSDVIHTVLINSAPEFSSLSFLKDATGEEALAGVTASILDNIEKCPDLEQKEKLKARVGTMVAKAEACRADLDVLFLSQVTNTIEFVKSVENPVTIIYGEEDPVATLENQNLMIENFKLVNYQVIPGAPHYSMLTHSEKVVQTIYE